MSRTPPDPTAAAPSLGARILHFLADSRPVFHYGRLPAYWGTFGRLARALDLQAGERLLDVGCGTGVGARLARDMYVGLDTDLEHLRFARAHAPRPSCSFVNMSALRLGFAGASFDKAVLINMVHHLDENILDRLLDQLRGVVRKRVCVLDVAPDASNAVSRFFLGHDRGDHIRERHDLRAALDRYFEVAGEEVFHNFLRTIPQVLFTLAPR